MINYKITAQTENGEIVTIKKKFANDTEMNQHLDKEIKPYAFVLSIEAKEQGVK